MEQRLLKVIFVTIEEWMDYTAEIVCFKELKL